MQKKKISQNVRLSIAAAGTFLFADYAGHLLTGPASQAVIACLHRADKIRRKQVLLALIRRAEQKEAVAGRICHITQAKEHKLCCAE